MRASSTLILGALLLGGCATSTTPAYDARFGEAVRQSAQGMRLNPAPAPLTGDAAASDGKAVREATERYHDSFRKPPAPVNVINIGGASGGAGR